MVSASRILNTEHLCLAFYSISIYIHHPARSHLYHECAQHLRRTLETWEKLPSSCQDSSNWDEPFIQKRDPVPSRNERPSRHTLLSVTVCVCVLCILYRLKSSGVIWWAGERSESAAISIIYRWSTQKAEWMRVLSHNRVVRCLSLVFWKTHQASSSRCCRLRVRIEAEWGESENAETWRTERPSLFILLHSPVFTGRAANLRGSSLDGLHNAALGK